MRFESIADIYAANENIRSKFRAVLGGVTADEASALPEGEKWTIEQIVEHVSLVNTAMTKICTRLMTKSKDEGKTSNGGVTISDNFFTRSSELIGLKVEAPDFVQPEGGKSIRVSLAVINEVDASLAGLKPLFETYDADTHKFPHPFFGELSATEWLVLLGGHEARHTAQIERILSGIRAA